MPRMIHTYIHTYIHTEIACDYFPTLKGYLPVAVVIHYDKNFGKYHVRSLPLLPGNKNNIKCVYSLEFVEGVVMLTVLQ